MIYAERKKHNTIEILEKGVFLDLIELAEADTEARTHGEHWSGTLATSIAMSRYRRNRCMYCGAPVGANHVDCEPGTINEAVYGR